MSKRIGGSLPTGPSEQYLRLLKGEIRPDEYAASVEKRVRDSTSASPDGPAGETAVRKKQN